MSADPRTRAECWTQRRTIGSSLGDWPLATSSADTDTIDDIALLSLIAEAASFVRSRRTRGTVNDVQLAKLY